MHVSDKARSIDIQSHPAWPLHLTFSSPVKRVDVSHQAMYLYTFFSLDCISIAGSYSVHSCIPKIHKSFVSIARVQDRVLEELQHGAFKL